MKQSGSREHVMGHEIIYGNSSSNNPSCWQLAPTISITTVLTDNLPRQHHGYVVISSIECQSCNTKSILININFSFHLSDSELHRIVTTISVVKWLSISLALLLPTIFHPATEPHNPLPPTGSLEYSDPILLRSQSRFSPLALHGLDKSPFQQRRHKSQTRHYLHPAHSRLHDVGRGGQARGMDTDGEETGCRKREQE